MTHNEHLTDEQVLAYVDGTVDYLQLAGLTAHLAGCEQCRREVALHKSVRRAVRSGAAVSPSSGFTRKVMSRVAPSPARLALRWVLDNMGAMFASMAVLGVVGAFVFGQWENGGRRLTLPDIDLTPGSRLIENAWVGLRGLLTPPDVSFVPAEPVWGMTNVALLIILAILFAAVERTLRRRGFRSPGIG